MGCNGCNNFNGNKSNGMFQANLGSWRSNDRRLSRTIACVNNQKKFTYSDATVTNDGRGAFINRRFTRMDVNSFNPNTKLKNYKYVKELNKINKCK
jgi:hypothetical protein